MLSEISCTTLSSLDELWTAHNPEDESVRVLIGGEPRHEDPEQQVEMEELRRALAKAIDALPERDRLVITLYYYEGLTLKEIGEILEISESRVSQIHTKAVLRLRGRLGRWRSHVVGV